MDRPRTSRNPDTATGAQGGPDAPTQEQQERVLRLVHQVFGRDLRGVYLHGSAVLGGLRPTSDLDLFVVTRRPATDAERRALVDQLLTASGAGGPRSARPVELTVVVDSDVRPWRYPPVCDFQYGEWLREEYERGDLPVREPSPDLAPLVTIVLLGDRPLYGPRPSEILGPVPRDDLARAMADGVPQLLAELEEDTRNVVLTLARIRATLETGTINSKDVAANWVLARLPARHRAVLAHARAVYLGEAAEDWSGLRDELRPFAAHLVREIERAAAHR
ncbi:Streptomycin 3''-adenylyltransferase [Streptomyces sp. YIM 130001]|uniref:aminoglycoside adenylyltransferase family protein n=1 Tax=Streptomyces sp. YIM 130001 TaxID=2259644 RepID=UPI000E65662D|nr:aminoglycoside adenylyltransferase family protein [Streptomyces sp. YIM 130001]RII14685.1 Streptomycin 3''-adenylyltransferase [Streptomyces sp. YIM 130001]